MEFVGRSRRDFNGTGHERTSESFFRTGCQCCPRCGCPGAGCSTTVCYEFPDCAESSDNEDVCCWRTGRYAQAFVPVGQVYVYASALPDSAYYHGDKLYP